MKEIFIEGMSEPLKIRTDDISTYDKITCDDAILELFLLKSQLYTYREELSTQLRALQIVKIQLESMRDSILRDPTLTVADKRREVRAIAPSLKDTRAEFRRLQKIRRLHLDAKSEASHRVSKIKHRWSVLRAEKQRYQAEHEMTPQQIYYWNRRTKELARLKRREDRGELPKVPVAEELARRKDDLDRRYRRGKYEPHSFEGVLILCSREGCGKPRDDMDAHYWESYTVEEDDD